ncbi:DUF3037 domain-containing protein [Rhizobacter sp. OV335]|uniref:DUF3037 domain-containing protein n=1 Tax=Rhizobacter sp. OV335 TaxID=1500264 RepID=UPI00093705F3|nr:DUF3037 domain-containing protein [Rhizobacter sp. OV335]
MIKTPFTFLRARPDELRGEQLNVGLIAFHPDRTRVRMGASSWRLRVLHPNLDGIDWDAWGEELEDALAEFDSMEAQLGWLQSGSLGAVYCDDSLGRLESADDVALERAISELAARMIEIPQRTVAAPAQPPKSKTRLNTHLRGWFRASKVFSPRVSDLSNNKVVPSYPVDVSDDLYADFALMNGAVHIIEALDYRGIERVTKGLRGEAGVTAVLFDQARQSLQGVGQRIAVTAADDYSKVRPLIGLVRKYADVVVAMESQADRQWFADFVSRSLKVERELLPIRA